jgi:outer membrane protein assembly factor BamB
MKKAVITTIILALITIAVFPNSRSVENEITVVVTTEQYEKGYRYNVQGWVYIHLEGEPYERGYQYGYLASAEIIDSIYRWSEFAKETDFMKIFIFKQLPKNYDKLREKIWGVCKSNAMRVFYKQIPDEYIQEMRGITDGINARGGKIFGHDIKFGDVMTVNLLQDSMLTIKNFKNRFHPFRGILRLHGIKALLKMLTSTIKSGLVKPDHFGHCSAFIATGDFTKDGEIVIAHSSYFNPNVAERANIILDVQPSEGYRFMMTAPPGSLWSQEDFYINEKGILMTETEYAIKGPWKKGIPKGVRSRKAIQYSDSIDEVIEIMQKGNDGIVPNEWLIGDTKTGEIASLEQPLYNTKIKRTFNGFYSSYAVPHDKKVTRELYGIVSFIPSFSNILSSAYARGRDKKFADFEEQYHGKIDEEIAKKILATPPINWGMTDGKVTSSKLMENMGMIIHMGNSDGTERVPTEKEKERYKSFTILPGTGWLEVYPFNSKETVTLLSKVKVESENRQSKIFWELETGDDKNGNYSNFASSDDIIYTATSSGEIYALKSSTGKKTWIENIGQNPVEPVVYKDLLIIGSNNGLHVLDKNNGKSEWEKSIGKVVSKPINVNELVIVSDKNNNIFAFDIENGKEKWTYSFDNTAYISEAYNNKIYIGSGNTCYCYNINKKEIIWEYQTQGLITSSPKINGNRVYFGSWDGNLYALNSNNGEFIWKYPTNWGIDSTPEISEGVVFVGSLDNNFYAINEKDGALKWYFTCKSAIHSNPVAYGDYVFFGCDDGRFYALNKEDGDFVWSFAPGYTINDNDVNNYVTTPILSNPVVEDSIVYFGAKGNIYALDAQTVEKPIEEPKEKIELDQYMYLILLIIVIFVIIMIIIVPRKKKSNEVKK